MKNWNFILVVTLIYMILIKLPVQYVFRIFFSEELSNFIKVLLVGFLIIYFSNVAAKKFELLKTGGFTESVIKNLWLLLIPLIFPGFLGLSGANKIPHSFSISFLSNLVVILMKAMTEEVVFRGLILGRLMKIKPSRPGRNVLISALIFGLLHFANLPGNDFYDIMGQAIYAFYMGLLFGILLVKTRNVWLLGLVHGLLNFIFSPHDSATQLIEPVIVYSFRDYIIQAIKLAVLFSPILIFYFVLLKKVTTDHTVN